MHNIITLSKTLRTHVFICDKKLKMKMKEVPNNVYAEIIT